MALSTCGKCGGRFFEVAENEPSGGNFKVMFIQCRSCGNVVGVTDFWNTAALLENLAKRLGVGDIFKS